MTNEITRRDLLRGLGGLAVAGPLTLSAFRAQAAGTHSIVPALPNAPLAVAGVQAYAEKSVRAGDFINFRVSSTVPYRLSVTRLGWDTDSPSKDWTVHSFSEAPAAQQVIRPGSYVHVERALETTTPQSELTLECWVRPFQNGWQGLISQYSYSASAGVGLFLASSGLPAFYFGTGGVFEPDWLRYGPSPIPVLVWSHLCVVFKSGEAELYVDGVLVGTETGLPTAVIPGENPLRLGAYGTGANTTNFMNGDLAMPAIYDRALGALEIATRASTRPPVPATDSIGCWPLDEETGVDVADVSGCGRDGVIVNRGTWMVGGPGFDAAAIPRFDPYDPDTDSSRGHAVRFSTSDFYDCAWPISHSYALPSELSPGVYVGRITHSGSQRYDVTFVVNKAATRPAAPILVVCATNTWLAYNSAFGLFSFYQNHAAGQPTYYVGIDVPWPSADPYAIYIPAYNYSHLVRAERFGHVWLEQNGYEYDMVSDRDLHEDPDMLSDYSAVFILGHSEYWSKQAYDGLRSYLSSGGHLFMGSGNTMFWRVSFDDKVIECRKLPVNVGGRANAEYGELYHEHDQDRGGLMREAGLPAWQAIGLECIGYGGPHVPYQVTDPTHEFFHLPESIAVSIGTQLGGPNGVGHEWDARVDVIPGPHNPMLPAEYNPVVLAEGRGGNQRLDYQANWVGGANQVISEVIDWPWAGGGRVLAAGSIAAGAALHADSKMAALLRNALHHFEIGFRVNALAIDQGGQFRNKWFDGTDWGPSFTSWQDMGGDFGDHPPTGVMWAPNRISAMAVASNGDFNYRWWDGSVWSGWNVFGSGFAGRPAAVGWGRNRLQLFARGADGHLYEYAWDGSTWAGWTSLGSGITSDPTAASREGTHLAVAALGSAGQVLYKWYSNGNWLPTPTTWQDMGGNFAHAPTLLSWGGRFLNLFGVDSAGGVYSKHWDGSNWWPSVTGWDYLGGELSGRVVAGVRGANDFTLFGIGTDGRLKSKWWDGSAWNPSPTGWSDLGGDLVGEPAVASYRGETLSVLAVGSDGRAKHLLWDGAAWSPWQDMGGNLRGSPAIFPWVGPPGANAAQVPLAAGGAALLGMGLAAAGMRALRQDPED